MVSYLFAKEFGEVQSAQIVNNRQYIILIIAAKRMLASKGMMLLPHIIGGRVNRLVSKRNINKKELQKIEASPYYSMIHENYYNEKTEQDVLCLIAQILSSEFQFIDYNMPQYTGNLIPIIPDVVSEEVCRLVLEI